MRRCIADERRSTAFDADIGWLSSPFAAHPNTSPQVTGIGTRPADQALLAAFNHINVAHS
jgi:hypothetical protein